MIEIVFFDFDGVIAVNGHACVEISERLEKMTDMPAAQIEPIFHEIAKMLLTSGQRFADHINEFNGQLDSAIDPDQIISAIKKARLNDEMVALISKLHDKQVRTGIISDNYIERLDMIKAHPVFSKMSPIVISAHVGHTKPQSPDIFKMALTQAEVIAEKSLFIDDKLSCLETASKVGLQTFHFEGTSESFSALKKKLSDNDLL